MSHGKVEIKLEEINTQFDNAQQWKLCSAYGGSSLDAYNSSPSLLNKEENRNTIKIETDKKSSINAFIFIL